MNHDEYTARLERVFKRWEDMRKYANTARRETLTIWRNGQWVTFEVVTVTYIDKRNGGHDERN